MTATPLAQGTSLKCDAPRCTRPATVDKDVWSFCDEHANEKVAPAPARAAPRAAPQQAVSVGPSATGANPTAVRSSTGASPVVGTIGPLLEQATGHSSPRVRRLAERIEADLDRLRALVRELAADERRKTAEQAAKQQAQAEVTRLEQQLAAAKAKLRGQVVTAPKTSTPVSAAGPKVCRDCGTEIVRVSGTVGVLPSRCPDCKAKA